MLTPEGQKWVGEQLAKALMAGAWIVVSDGAGESEVSTITDASVGVAEDGSVAVIARAIFGQAEANFEWKKRSVKLADGTVIDADVSDAGRKVASMEWEYEVTIEVQP